MVDVKPEPVEEISIKKVQEIVTNWSKSTAQRKIDLCRDALGKKKHQIISVKEFCMYFGLL